jgi:hypothetical protein
MSPTGRTQVESNIDRPHYSAHNVHAVGLTELVDRYTMPGPTRRRI